MAAENFININKSDAQFIANKLDELIKLDEQMLEMFPLSKNAEQTIRLRMQDLRAVSNNIKDKLS